jgi:hypothetical protein
VFGVGGDDAEVGVAADHDIGEWVFERRHGESVRGR